MNPAQALKKITQEHLPSLFHSGFADIQMSLLYYPGSASYRMPAQSQIQGSLRLSAVSQTLLMMIMRICPRHDYHS